MASNLSTVCVLPCSNNVPLSAFTMELKNALDTIGKMSGKKMVGRTRRVGRVNILTIYLFQAQLWF